MNEIKQTELDERKFLHDIATPLATAMMSASFVLEELQSRSDSDPEDLKRLMLLCKALEKIQDMLVERKKSYQLKELPMPESKEVNILIVDDEPNLRSALVFDFKRKGFQVFEAENGKKAFEIVKNNKIDLILTDVQMPGGGGVELLDNVKALNPNMPVVMFITGFAEITLEEACNKGVEAVFSKPFSRKALFDAVFKTITNKEEQWGTRKLDRLGTDFKITLSFPEVNLSAEGVVLNIGRGGFFVCLQDHFPQVENEVHFSFKFAHGPIKEINGQGIVRWVREKGDENIRAGCGVEFTYLDDSSRQQIIFLVNELKTTAFIPKT